MKINLKLFIFFYLNFLLLANCQDKGKNPSQNSNDDIPILAGYSLFWHDEFTAASIDSTEWEHKVNAHCGGNNALQ